MNDRSRSKHLETVESINSLPQSKKKKPTSKIGRGFTPSGLG